MPPKFKRQSLEIVQSDSSSCSETHEGLGNYGNETDEDVFPPISPAKGQDSSIIARTSFDAYFTHAASRAQTSSNIFSNLVLPLSEEEYNEAIARAKPRLKRPQPAIVVPAIRDNLFSRFLLELEEGFNVLCYGYGSKRQLLNQFATDICSKKGHVIIANGFQPNFTIKDLLDQLENIPGILHANISSSALEKRAHRISQFFSPSSLNMQQAPHLFVVIHNIDCPTLRTPRAKSILSLLAMTSKINIIASIDHLNAPLTWSSSESTTRKPSYQHSHPQSTSSSKSAESLMVSRGFSWLYHDLTTLSSYDFELSYIDHTSLSSAHGGGSRKKTYFTSALTSALNPSISLPGGGTTNMSETAALHVLASVTQKAQKLFTLLGERQLDALEESGSGNGTNIASGDPQATAIGYDVLFNLARGEFVATNDTALRALLGEFRDHGLIVSAQGASGDGGEILWIPLRKQRLANVLQNLRGHGQ